ncbi:hypothetical protein C7271_06625 [filamentous cyanobacterium CCP5]|nr:hypothetical protein C7271_06625 [filamentous cyanobacterium CCP5]
MASSADFPGPLNPGNVVSAGLKLYRDRFKTYLGLSVRAYLWLLVPIYGWAKYFMLTGVMSRLACQDLMQQPESVEVAKARVNPKLWSFFGLGLLMVVIILGAYLGLVMVGGLAGLLAGLVTGGAATAVLGSDIGTGVGIAFGVLVFVGIFLIGLIWLVARLLIAEVPLAIEPQTTASDSIGRSWMLSRLSVVRIQFVVLAAFLINLPVILVTNTFPQLTLGSVTPDSAAFWILYSLSIVLSILGNMLVLPFWQTVKGVLYYDLRNRREGVDLQT